MWAKIWHSKTKCTFLVDHFPRIILLVMFFFLGQNKSLKEKFKPSLSSQLTTEGQTQQEVSVISSWKRLRVRRSLLPSDQITDLKFEALSSDWCHLKHMSVIAFNNESWLWHTESPWPLVLIKKLWLNFNADFSWQLTNSDAEKTKLEYFRVI